MSNIEFYLFIGSAICSFEASIDFTIFYVKCNYNCMLFSQIFELKRTYKPGSPINCCTYLVAEYLIAFLSCLVIWKSRKRQLVDLYVLFRGKLVLVVLGIVFLKCLGGIILWKGFNYVCEHLDFTKWCTTEVFHNFDFKTFTPKYTQAYRFQEHYSRCMVSSWLGFLCWTMGILICYYKSCRINNAARQYHGIPTSKEASLQL